MCTGKMKQFFAPTLLILTVLCHLGHPSASNFTVNLPQQNSSSTELVVENVSAVDKPDNIRKPNAAGFFFSMPKTLLAGKNETVCVTLHYASTSYLASAVVMAKVIVDLKVREKHFFTTRHLDAEHSCFEMTVPSLDLKEPKYASVRVQVHMNKHGGEIHAAHNHDPILIYPAKLHSFVETDRPAYKAGDHVKIRILMMNENMLPPKQYKIPQVRIRNPLDIAVVVWENVSTELGLAQLEHQISKDAIEGKWRIEVNNMVRPFDVKKYVLPRFKVEIDHPKMISTDIFRIPIRICSHYSYGGHVKGSAFVRLTDQHHNIETVQNLKQMDSGCANFTFLGDDLHLSRVHHKFATSPDTTKIHIDVTATVTEYGTDKIELATSRIQVSLRAYDLKFATWGENHFLPGLPYRGKLILTDGAVSKGHPVEQDVVQVCYNLAIKRSWNYQNMEQCRNFTVGARKIFKFLIPPMKNNVIHLQLQARSLNHSHVEDSLLIVRLYSPNSNYIYLEQASPAPGPAKGERPQGKCGSVQQFWVHYTADHFREGENVTFYYMIKTRNQIQKLKKIVHTVRKHYLENFDDSNSGAADDVIVIGTKHKHNKFGTALDKFLLQFKLDQNILSDYRLLVYYVSTQNGGETVAANKNVEIEPCLNNKVRTRWWSKRATPGTQVPFLIETSSNSLCSISAVDKSTEFLENRMTSLNAFSFLEPFTRERQGPLSNRKTCVHPVKKSKGPSPLTENEAQLALWDSKRRKKRHVFPFSEDYDAYDVFNAFGTTIITNFKLITKPCYTGPNVAPPTNPGVQFLTDQYETQSEEKGVPIRSFFPETWLWELVPVKGSTIITRDLPHTITEWTTKVLCVSATQGVGFSETTQIVAFQPFFVDVLLPYSIKRGEVLYMHVILFNYLNYNLPIRITLGDTVGLKLVDLMNRRTVSYCVSSNDTITHVFEVQGTEIGNVNVTVLAEVDSAYPGQCGPETVVNKRDVILKNLLIEPEGYPIKVTRSAFLCAAPTKNDSDGLGPENNESQDSVTWDMGVLNTNVVQHTAKLKVTVNGDLLGQTIEHLENLVTVPTGCGEQIIASLAPNLYVMRYLNATQNLTPSMRQRAVRNLKIGYQRILNFVHKDGSFSAFGPYQDLGGGSMFLTAFVVRTLHQAKEYIYVDQKVIEKAVNWILGHQLENGCFSAMLHVFQDMGGSSTENSTAALSAYVMISLIEAHIAIPESVKTNAKYCIRGHYNQLEKYTMAISSYALFKIEWMSEANRILRKLEQLASRKDNMMWWSSKDMDTSTATDIEITSYVLLSLLSYTTQENLAKAHSIVRWLTTKLNPKGGFRSTQDTVVALEALARYSTFINSKNLNLDIIIDAKQQNIRFRMEKDDRLKSKRYQLREARDNRVQIKVLGEGCVLGQLVSSYYLRQVPSSDTFKLDTEVASVSNVDQCSIASLSTCLAYNGPDTQSNMAVLEVGLPSGYQADRASLYQLKDDNTSKMKMFEEIDDKVMLYFTQLDREKVCVNFKINEKSIVQGRRESAIKLYDYYKPEFEVLQFYKINEKCAVSNFTMPQITGFSNKTLVNVTLKETDGNISKRSLSDLNPDFVDMDVELATPDGAEGNAPVRIKPNFSTITIDNFEQNRIDAAQSKNVAAAATSTKRIRRDNLNGVVRGNGNTVSRWMRI